MTEPSHFMRRCAQRGIDPDEAREVLANPPLIRRDGRGRPRAVSAVVSGGRWRWLFVAGEVGQEPRTAWVR